MVWTDGRMDGMMDRSNERRAEPKISAVPTTIVARSPREERERGGRKLFPSARVRGRAEREKKKKAPTPERLYYYYLVKKHTSCLLHTGSF